MATPPQRPPAATTSPRISPARRAAFQILQAVQSGQGNSDNLLHSDFTAGLSQLDRNLATTLVMGVLRWQISLDARIAPLLQRPKDPLPAPVATALRLGAFQLLHLDRIPAHAAISESVELCRLGNQPQATGMVNAILRKLTAPALGFTPTSPLLQLALETAHPVWLLDRWKKNYGEPAARAIALAGQQQPVLTMRRAANDDTPLPEGWQPGALLTCAQRRESGSDAVAATTQFMEEGSQLVAEIAAAVFEFDTASGQENSPQKNYSPAKILDTCAAPGGKTLILAERHPTAAITACDASPSRLADLRQRLQQFPHITCQQADAAALPPALTGFDRILCDAPCSGTGTLARNPEIRHRLQPGELARHAERQRNILRSALSRLAPATLLTSAGTLIYSTCSLEPEENEQVIREVLTQEKDFQLVDVRLALDALLAAGILLPAAHQLLTATAVKDGCLRTLPGIHPCDGFFVAILTRKY